MKKPSHRSTQMGILLIATLLTPFILFSSKLLPWEGSSSALGLVQEIIYPIEYSWNFTSRAISNTWHNYIDLSNAASENRKLKSRIGELRARTIDYEENVLEISRLRKLLGFAQRYEKKLHVAEVIGHPQNVGFKSIRISRGQLDGVLVGMPVVTTGGVVGKVIRTGLKYSDVHLLVDSNFNLDILLQRTRVRGVLRGLGENKSRLDLHHRAEIRIGDTLITSGIVGGFPKGLPVGRVIRISYDSDNVSQSVTVETWVDYRRIEEVLILEEIDQEIHKIMEISGKDWVEKSIGKVGGG